MPDEQPDAPVTGEPASGVPDEPVADAPVAAAAQMPAVDDAGLVVRETNDEAAVPDEATLARIATPGIARRAPKYGAFIGYGAVLGFVVGVALAFVMDRGDLVNAGEGGGVLPFLGGSNGAKLLTGVALAGFGALLGALLALWADARSRRR